MNEIYVVRQLLSRDNYIKYRKYIDVKEPHELVTLYKLLDKLHNDLQRDVSLNEFCMFAEQQQLENYVTTLRDESVPDSSIEEILLDISSRQWAYEHAKVAVDVYEGRKTLLDLQEHTLTLPTQKALIKSPWVTDSVDELKEAIDRTHGLRWRLPSIQDALGGLVKGNFGFLFARPESFTRDTEVLTTTGWKTVDSVTLDDEIAQVSESRVVTFTKPIAIHTHEQDEIIHIHDKLGRVDLAVTKGHGMVVEKKGKLVKVRADEVLYYQGVKHHTSGNGIGNSTLTCYDRLAIAYQADGSKRQYKGNLVFSLIKERKVNRLKDILHKCGYEYSLNQHKTGHWYFYISVNDGREYKKDFSWVDIRGVNTKYALDFIEELSYWDATRRTKTRFKFDTTNHDVANIVQAICSLGGFNCKLSISQDDRKVSYKDLYSLSIRTNYMPVDGQCIVKEVVPYTDTTYCFQVPTGALLVRRNGAVAICGNTGKTTFLATNFTYFATQTTQPVIWLNNEEEGRKVKARLMQSALQMPYERFMTMESSKIEEEYLKRTNHAIKLGDFAVLHRRDVEKILIDESPAILVIDQIDKIKGFKADRREVMLGELYVWAREMAKSHCPIIGVCQASGSAEGKKWLTMEDVAESKTSKAAEADFIIGIGKSHDEGYENLRYIHLIKNKLAGKTGHKITCRILPEIARYEDI